MKRTTLMLVYSPEAIPIIFIFAGAVFTVWNQTQISATVMILYVGFSVICFGTAHWFIKKKC